MMRATRQETKEFVIKLRYLWQPFKSCPRNGVRVVKSEIEKEFDTYIKKTIKNTIINFSKKELKKRQGEISLDILFDIPDERTLSFFDTANKIEELFEDERLSRIIAALPEEQKKVLKLSILEGYTSKEIANLIGKTDSAVRHMISRTLKLIRKKYEE